MSVNSHLNIKQILNVNLKVQREKSVYIGIISHLNYLATQAVVSESNHILQFNVTFIGIGYALAAT